MHQQKKKFIHEREIWILDLEPTKGVEIKKSRPCLVLRKFSSHQLVIIPITSRKKSNFYAFDLGQPSFLHKPVNFLNISQIRSVDAQRFKRYLGKISPTKFKAVQKKSAEVLKLLPREPNGQNCKLSIPSQDSSVNKPAKNSQ